MNEYEVIVGFASYVGIEETYNIDADSEEEAEELAIEEARWDLGATDVEDLGDGEYRVTVNFAGYVGGEEEYTVDADSEEEAEENAVEEAVWDLGVVSITKVGGLDEDDEDKPSPTNYKYSLSWTRKNGERVRDQLYTADNMSKKLQELENEGATDIEIIVRTDIK